MDGMFTPFHSGYAVTQIPGGWLGTRFGSKRVYGYGILCTTLLTLVTPLVAHSIPLLLVVRVVEGLGEGVTYPSIHAFWSRWAPPLERSKLTTLSYSGAYLGTVMALLASGPLCASSLGWPSVFYVFGGIGVAVPLL